MVEDGDSAREIRDEEEARLERGDEERLAAGVVGRELGAELAHARGDVLRGEVDLAHRGVGGGQEASRRWYRSASRSTSRL